MHNLSFVGNIATDIKLNTETPSGVPRLNFKVAINEGERGTDAEKSHFVPFTAFGTLAENMAASVKKGDRVSVIARLNTYEKAVQIDGEDKNITMVGFTAQEVGPALRWATAQVSKVGGKAKSADSYAGDDEDAKPAKKAPAKRTAPAKPAAAEADDDF